LSGFSSITGELPEARDQNRQRPGFPTTHAAVARDGQQTRRTGGGSESGEPAAQPNRKALRAAGEFASFRSEGKQNFVSGEKSLADMLPLVFPRSLKKVLLAAPAQGENLFQSRLPTFDATKTAQKAPD